MPGMENYLYSFGPAIQFTVFPLNVQNVDHTTGSDWAKKEIAGAAMYREWVGESDEEIVLRGRLHPHYMAKQLRRINNGGDKSGGGFYTLDLLDTMRRLGQSHLLMRGDGWKIGWFVLEKLSRGHSLLGPDGIGQQIDFTASFVRVPVPDPSTVYAQIYAGDGSTSGGAAP
jgi:phage protein U